MEAVRNIPYGIQQPAVSGQVAQLEEFLGATLFQRRPFTLTPAGEKLFQFIQPFFSNLDSIASELQGGKVRQLRIGASTIVLRDHLPGLLQKLRKKFPNLKIGLREGYQVELESLLLREELDLLITPMEGKVGPGIHTSELLKLPLELLVAQDSPIKSAAQLWQKDRIGEPLICLPAAEAISKSFQRGLARLGVDWFPGIEVSSLDLIERYVAAGFGIGLSVRVPKPNLPSGVRALPLQEFEPVVMGALWRGRPNALLQAFLDEIQLHVKSLAGGNQ
jgi:DNA-binding transcriptional LysR family regulator